MAKEKNKSSSDVGVGLASVGGAGYGSKKLIDKGYVDGRTTIYHGTSEDAARKIKKEGVKSKYTAVGSNEAGSITDRLHDKDVVKKSKGHTFFTKSRLGASEYAAQHGRHKSRSAMPTPERLVNMFDHFLGKKKGVVKARVPLYARKLIRNPEAYSSYEEWKKHLGIGGFIIPESQKRKIYKSLEEAVVIKGDVNPEFIKGDKYKRIGMSEYRDFISHNKGKAAIGAAGMAGLGALGIYGLNKIRHGLLGKKDK